jgi:hypothetical protein
MIARSNLREIDLLMRYSDLGLPVSTVETAEGSGGQTNLLL